jgi:hypothetical protein
MGKDTNHTLIVSHAVLAGLTALIPVPLVDDLVEGYIQRRLVRRLAAGYGLNLGPAEIEALAEGPSRGCLRGCAIAVTLYPLKKIFRKIFYFLEWKRAIDLASRTYHYAYLTEHALRQGWIAPAGPRSAADVRAGIEAVCREARVTPVERAVQATFSQSKAALRSAAELMTRSLRGIGRQPAPERVAQAVEETEEREEQEIAGVAARLQNAINQIPAEYFQNLREKLALRLGLSGARITPH